MSSEEFWEQSPQLYWAYRTFYFKKMEIEAERAAYNSWLQGNMNSIAVSIAISNSFSKGKKIDFPAYNEVFKNRNTTQTKKLSPKEEKNRINLKVQDEFNSMARF